MFLMCTWYCTVVSSTWTSAVVTVVRYALIKSNYQNNQSDEYIRQLAQLVQQVRETMFFEHLAPVLAFLADGFCCEHVLTSEGFQHLSRV
jgi:hypothetical protein